MYHELIISQTAPLSLPHDCRSRERQNSGNARSIREPAKPRLAFCLPLSVPLFPRTFPFFTSDFLASGFTKGSSAGSRLKCKRHWSSKSSRHIRRAKQANQTVYKEGASSSISKRAQTNVHLSHKFPLHAHHICITSNHLGHFWVTWVNILKGHTALPPFVEQKLDFAHSFRRVNCDNLCEEKHCFLGKLTNTKFTNMDIVQSQSILKDKSLHLTRSNTVRTTSTLLTSFAGFSAEVLGCGFLKPNIYDVILQEILKELHRRKLTYAISDLIPAMMSIAWAARMLSSSATRSQDEASTGRISLMQVSCIAPR